MKKIEDRAVEINRESIGNHQGWRVIYRLPSSLVGLAVIRLNFSSMTMETPNIDAAYVTHWATYHRTEESMRYWFNMNEATANPAPVSSMKAAVKDRNERERRMTT